MAKNDFITTTLILSSTKPSKPIECIPAPNPYTANRIRGITPDGTEIVVALRPTKGGLPFAKLLGGKIYAVAIDGCSPSYEKSDSKTPNQTPVQKTDEATGLPLYSGAGVYQLSSKEHPSLSSFPAYTRLSTDLTSLYIIPQHKPAINLAATPNTLLSTLRSTLEPLIQTTQNWCEITNSRGLPRQENEPTINSEINKKRKRLIQAAQDEALDNDETYDGVPFAELPGTPKDGVPFALILIQTPDLPQPKSLLFTIRHIAPFIPKKENPNNKSQLITTIHPFPLAWDNFARSTTVRKVISDLETTGNPLQVKVLIGYHFRPSVSFKTKLVNCAENPKGIGLEIILQQLPLAWTKTITSVLYSRHPAFPAQEYTSNHYVVACHQAEVAMQSTGTTQLPDPDNPTKTITKKTWANPQAIPYTYADLWNSYPA